MNPIVVAIFTPVVLGLVGALGAVASNWLDLHGHKEAARVERALVDALVSGIKQYGHEPTKDAIVAAAQEAGLEYHPVVEGLK